MKTLRYLVAISMVIMAVVVSGCGQNKNVGVIDVEKVVTESPKIKVMNEELMAKHKEIEEKLNTDKTTLSEADFNNAKQAADTEFTALRKDLSGKMETEIKTNLEKIAKEKNLSVIIKKNVTVQGGVDVTDEMIAKLQ
ncbi:MAG: OmpH family outer membrane protein [Negativicutes bacterium]|nr:OmpH family outer membrane protein [Negativicutes bacterium]MBP9950059.1 OmpH family outer membrane protein [Negativicutes bacterium]